MNKRVVWVLVGAAIIITGIVAVFFLWNPAVPTVTGSVVQRPFSVDPIPTESFSQPGTFSQLGTVARIAPINGTTYFRVQGTMATNLKRQGTTLVGEYTIDGDPGVTRVNLVLETGKSLPGIIYFPTGFDDDADGQPTTETELLARLTRGTKVFLMINTGQSDTQSPVRDALSAVEDGKWSYLSGITLSPYVVGVIAPPPR